MYQFSDLPYIGEECRVRFPDPRQATEEGILGVGGNLSPGVLLSAYEQGIFPWYSSNEPILWWSPDPRFVLFPSEFHISRRRRRDLAKEHFRVSMDRRFEAVIRSCASVERPEQDGTWISEEMIAAYCELYRLGHAHSVEVWNDDELVGGLYGVCRGRIFFGESMFSLRSGTSTLALAALREFLQARQVALIDSQVESPHIERHGGRNIPRERYLKYLDKALSMPAIKGWDYHEHGKALLSIPEKNPAKDPEKRPGMKPETKPERN